MFWLLTGLSDFGVDGLEWRSISDNFIRMYKTTSIAIAFYHYERSIQLDYAKHNYRYAQLLLCIITVTHNYCYA